MTGQRVPWTWRRYHASPDDVPTWAKVFEIAINCGVAAALALLAGWATIYCFGTM